MTPNTCSSARRILGALPAAGAALRRGWRDTRGANLVEGALVLPMVLFLTFAIIDFATLSYSYLALENGVSQATRFAVTGNVLDDPDKPGAKLSRTDSIIAAMRHATPTLTLPADAFSFSHLPPGAGAWVGGTGGPNDVEKVRVQYTWMPLTPVLRPFLTDGKLIVVVDSAMKNEGRFE